MAEPIKLNDEGILFRDEEQFLIYAIPKNGKPRKARALRVVKTKDGKDQLTKDGRVVHEVPTSDNYAYLAHKLPNGSTLQINWNLPIPHAERMAMYEAGKKAGLYVLEPEEKKARAPKTPKLTMEALMSMAPSAVKV